MIATYNIRLMGPLIDVSGSISTTCQSIMPVRETCRFLKLDYLVKKYLVIAKSISCIKYIKSQLVLKDAPTSRIYQEKSHDYQKWVKETSQKLKIMSKFTLKGFYLPYLAVLHYGSIHCFDYVYCHRAIHSVVRVVHTL